MVEIDFNCNDSHRIFKDFSRQSVQFSSVAQSCPTLCDPMNCSTPGLPVHHQLLEFTQTQADLKCLLISLVIYCNWITKKEFRFSENIVISLINTSVLIMKKYLTKFYRQHNRGFLETEGQFWLSIWRVLLAFHGEGLQMVDSMNKTVSQIPQYFSISFWLHPTACRILVPPPGIKPTPLHWKCRALITGPPGKLPFECLTTHSCRARPCEHLNLKLNSILHTYGRRRWHPTPVLLPGKSNGWRSLVGCSPWGR